MLAVCRRNGCETG